MPLREFLNNAGRVITSNSTTILTYLGVGGVITTAAIAVNDNVRAREILDRHVSKKNRGVYFGKRVLTADDLSFKEKAELTWTCYIPTAASVVLTSTCIIGAHKLNIKKQAALASLLGMSQEALREYRKQVAKQIGAKKAQRLDDMSVEEHVKDRPARERTEITGQGTTLFRDTLTEREFYSDIDKVKRVFHGLQHKLNRNGFVSVNDLYRGLNLRQCEIGDLVGWLDADGPINWRLTSVTVNDERIQVIQYELSPKHVYKTTRHGGEHYERY